MSDRWSRRRTRLDEDPFHRLLWPEVETDFARAFEMKDQFSKNYDQRAKSTYFSTKKEEQHRSLYD